LSEAAQASRKVRHCWNEEKRKAQQHYILCIRLPTSLEDLPTGEVMDSFVALFFFFVYSFNVGYLTVTIQRIEP